jgi:hypothetical protein
MREAPAYARDEGKLPESTLVIAIFRSAIPNSFLIQVSTFMGHET